MTGELFPINIQTVDGSIDWIPSKTCLTNASFIIKARSLFACDINMEFTSYVLEPDARVLAGVGFMLDLLPGWEAQIRTKHNLALDSGLIVLDSPSTIDSSHKDEIKIVLINKGEEDIEVKKGDEIAQMIITEVPHIKLQHVEKIQSPVKDT